MKIRRTRSFLKDYKKLPEEIKPRVNKNLGMLFENPKHPSLRFKNLKGTDKYEIRISKGYRLTLRYQDQILELRRVGTHDLLRKGG